MKSLYEKVGKDFGEIRVKSEEKLILNRFGIDSCNIN
jgi:hypothetical protein